MKSRWSGKIPCNSPTTSGHSKDVSWEPQSEDLSSVDPLWTWLPTLAGPAAGPGLHHSAGELECEMNLKIAC